jgi:hypothetical protein
MTEVVLARKFRNQVPDDHRESLDTRLLWLWHQRFGTVQTVYSNSPDILDVTAATLILQAVMARDLKSIQQLFQRLEGSSVYDEQVRAQVAAVRI